jgi:hypothetical protein
MRLLRYRRATERPSVRATYRLECRPKFDTRHRKMAILGLVGLFLGKVFTTKLVF